MKVLWCAACILPMMALGQTRTARYWFAYGDEAAAQRARASGIDANALLGREISGSKLAVPENGQGFKVQLWCQMMASDGLPRYGGGPSINIAFDRTFCGQANQNPPLNSDSFRKVRPAGVNQNDYVEAFTNGAIVPAWYSPNEPSDWNQDGIQDTAMFRYGGSLPSAWRQGVQGEGENLRPVGLATALSAGIIDPPEWAFQNGGFKMPHATPLRIIDINWVSMLNLGETYGDGPGETGLSITTSNVIGQSNTTAIVSGASHTGARYTLVAVVPEPASALALGLGAMLLLFRRRSR